MFYPRPCHHEVIGTGLYDYYGFIMQTLGSSRRHYCRA